MISRIFACLSVGLLLLSFTACRDENVSDNSAGDPAGFASTVLPPPDEKLLDELGPVNDIDVRWMLDNPLFVAVLHPKRFLESEIARGNEAFLAEAIAQLFNIPFPPQQLVRVVQANGLPFGIVVEGELNGQKVPEQVMMGRRTTAFYFDRPLVKEEVVRSLLMDPATPIESTRKTLGTIEYFDLTAGNVKHEGRAVLMFPDEKTVVLLEGHVSDLQTVFDGTAPKCAAAERLKRIDLKNCDLAAVLTHEGIAAPTDDILAILTQYGVPREIIELVAPNYRAATISLHLSASDETPILSVLLDTKDAKGASEIAEIVDGQIVKLQADWMGVDENIRNILVLPYEFITNFFNSLVVEAKGARVSLRSVHFEGFTATINQAIRNQQARLREMQLLESRREQLLFLGHAFRLYYDTHGKFPSDIKAADGTPLLSWRVALLPTMQLDELYAKFNLEEPWDGPTNKELLTQMPFLFRPLVPGVEPPKTVVRFFDSEGTPLANPGLKREDVKYPKSTLMLVSVTPSQAIEWTRPDVLAFDRDRLEETTGNILFGVTFAGEFIPGLPIFPLSQPGAEYQRQTLDAVVRGLPLPEDPAPESPPKEPGM